MSWRVDFEQIKFAEGRFRNAYKGTYVEPPSKAGNKCVVKEKKESYTWASSDWDTAKKNHAKATELASAFNSEVGPSYPISFTSIDTGKATIPIEGSSGPRDGEYLIVEEYIDGSFTKWCNNYGYISLEAESTSKLMPAFMHWSWKYTGGKVMVSDLQGVRQEYPKQQYKLTDPAILSCTREYGPTDMGIEGMAMFFLHHKCNEFCRGISRPTTENLKGNIPDHVLRDCMALLQQVLSSTTYEHELKFSHDTRKMVTRAFQTIANN